MPRASRTTGRKPSASGLEALFPVRGFDTDCCPDSWWGLVSCRASSPNRKVTKRAMWAVGDCRQMARNDSLSVYNIFHVRALPWGHSRCWELARRRYAATPLHRYAQCFRAQTGAIPVWRDTQRFGWDPEPREGHHGSWAPWAMVILLEDRRYPMIFSWWTVRIPNGGSRVEWWRWCDIDDPPVYINGKGESL